MKILSISLIIITLFTACSATRIGAHSDGKHHSVGAKTNLLKF
ncbi:hypothetical protein [Sulfurimonas sp.]